MGLACVPDSRNLNLRRQRRLDHSKIRFWPLGAIFSMLKQGRDINIQI